MSKIFCPMVILSLTLSFSVLAQQAPERTKPTSATTEETQPCWEQVMKTLAEGASCLAIFSKELEIQKNDPEALEELELAGVRFLKANGYSDESAIAIIAKKKKQLSLALVTETSEPTKPVTTEAVTPAPAASKETPKQVKLVKRTEESAQKKRLKDEQQQGWKAGLPEPEKKTGYCWEESHPEDLDGCVVQLKQYMNQIRKDKSLPSEDRDLAVKNFRFNLEKLKKLEKLAEKGVKTQRTWATSRANSMLRGCTNTWVHEKFAGPGSRYLDRASVNIYNNTGGEIREIKISDRGTIVERLCAGGSLVLHRHLEGQPYGVNFSFVAEALVFEGGVQKVYIWELPASIYRNSMNQAPVIWTLTKDNRRTY